DYIRVLLSFPTRRSSDLSNYYQIKWSGSGSSIVFLEQSSLGSFLHFYHPKSGLKTIDNLILQKQFPEYKISDKDVYVSDDGKKIDRKSTRLNSSHVKISY